MRTSSDRRHPPKDAAAFWSHQGESAQSVCRAGFAWGIPQTCQIPGLGFTRFSLDERLSTVNQLPAGTVGFDLGRRQSGRSSRCAARQRRRRRRSRRRARARKVLATLTLETDEVTNA
jgi:hypothetical protein